MNYKTTLNTILHFLVHNGFLFTVSVMGLVHATLLILSMLADVRPLVLFNILSVIVYLFCVLLCRADYIMPVYISILAEVTAYSVVSVYVIGWNSGSYNYLFSIVPIIIYFGCFLFKGSKRWMIVFLLAMNFTLFVIMYLLFADATPVYILQTPMRQIMRIFSTFVMFFSMVFYNTIYIYSSEVERNTLEKENVQLTDDANRDTLTQLLNRRGFLPVVDRYMRHEKYTEFCIAFCDIDNFKRINDSCGHDCGDEVLRHIAKLITRELPDCSVCRWGGEEIVILLNDYDIETGKEKMEEVRQIIESTPTVFFNKRVNKTLTIGLVEYNNSFRESEDLIRVADERMYYGKQHGKNIVVYKDAT